MDYCHSVVNIFIFHVGSIPSNMKMSHKSCTCCGHNWQKNPLFPLHIVSRPPCLTKHSNKTATVSETLKFFLADKMDIIYKYTEEE
jgi:hypothetical protein